MATFALIHGGGDVGWYWHLVERELRQRGHDVVAPDLPCDDHTAGLREYTDTVVAAIGLAFEDTEKKDIEAFVGKHPVVYPIAQVDVTEPPKDFDPPMGLPTTYLIAPDGHVAHRFVGPVDGVKLTAAMAKGQ